MNLELKRPRGDIIRHPARFKVLATGRRWGKTHLAVTWLHTAKLRPAESRWFVAPTYRQAKLIAWPILMKFYRSWGLLEHMTLNHTELIAALPNGAQIALKGADNPDSLRGVGLERVVLDEYAYMKPSVWPEVIRPMLSDTGGKALFIGTPDGLNHFYDAWQRGQGGDEAWKSWQFRSIDGGYIPESEINDARRDLDSRTFRQEYEASFETAANRVYHSFDRRNNVMVRNDLDGCQVIVGVDFNVGKLCAAIGRRTVDGVHWYDEIVLRDSNTFELATELRRRAPGAVVYPDPAGSARKTSATRSDHQILRDAGFVVRAHRQHPPVRDRINAVNALLCNSRDEVRMTVDPRCTEIIADWERVQWHNGEPDKRNDELTHMSDATGYPVEYIYPVTRRAVREVAA